MNPLDTLNVEEAAEYLKCSKNTIRNKAARGELPGLKVGKKYVFLREELANLLRKAIVKAHDEFGDGECQSKNEKALPTITIGSGTKAANSVLALARQNAKKRNK